MRQNLQTHVFFIQTVLGAELEQCVIWVGRDQWRHAKWRERERDRKFRVFQLKFPVHTSLVSEMTEGGIKQQVVSPLSLSHNLSKDNAMNKFVTP